MSCFFPKPFTYGQKKELAGLETKKYMPYYKYVKDIKYW